MPPTEPAPLGTTPYSPHGGSGGHSACTPASTPAWITRDLIDLTRKIWQPFYKEFLTPEIAVTILQGVGRLFAVISGSTTHETVRRIGTRQQS